jgi:predicted RNase H-related nuclease YkuK (DUF458 family)
MGWTTFENKEIDLYQFIEDHMGPNRKLVIGTDSQRCKKRKRKGKRKVTFCTIVAIVDEGSHRDAMRRAVRKVVRTDPFASLYERLMHEVWLTIDLANELSQVVDDIELHIDVNHDERWASSKFKSALTGYAAGSGYNYKIKPDAWCATAVADAQVR